VLACGHLEIREINYFRKSVRCLADEDQVEVAANDMEQLGNALKEIESLKSIEKVGDKFVLKFDRKISPEEINKYLFEKGISPSHLSVKKKSLEKQYLELTNKNA